MTEKITLHAILDEEASQIFQRETGIHKWKNKTQAVNEIFKGYGSFKQALEFIQKEPQKPKSISWDDQNLQPCVFRDLKGNELICRNKKAPLKTDHLTPDVCLACQELKKQHEQSKRASNATNESAHSGLSIDIKAIIIEYARKKKTDFNKALEMMIRETDRLHWYIRYLGTLQQIAEEAPECNRRILLNGEFYCVQTSKRGLQRMKELPSLDICRVCRLDKLNIPTRTKIQKKQEPRNLKKEWKDPVESELPYDNQGRNYRGDTHGQFST